MTLLIDDIRTQVTYEPQGSDKGSIIIQPQLIARRAQVGIECIIGLPRIEAVYLDHDLGVETPIQYKDQNGIPLRNNGYAVLQFLECAYYLRPKSIYIITSNPSARKKMNLALEALNYTPMVGAFNTEWVRLPD